MFRTLFRFVRDVQTLSDPTTRLEALRILDRAEMQERDEDTQKRGARVIYATPMPELPTREDARLAYANAEMLAEIARKNAEREKEQRESPGQKVIYIKQVRS